MTLLYPALFGRPIILAVVDELMNGRRFLVPMLVDTGADQTCFPSSFAAFFGHDNHHKDVVKDTCHGIGGVSSSYIHSVQISLMHPKKSTQTNPVIAWTCKNTKGAFIEHLDCGFGLLGMDIMTQWRSVSFQTDKANLTIRIVI